MNKFFFNRYSNFLNILKLLHKICIKVKYLVVSGDVSEMLVGEIWARVEVKGSEVRCSSEESSEYTRTHYTPQLDCT